MVVGAQQRIYKTLTASLVTLTILVGTAFSYNALGHDHGKLRMYKLNKKDQPIRQKWLSKTNEAGCHNTLKSRAVYRFAQLGFDYCALYAKEDCASGSEVSATWGGKKYKNADVDIKEPQINLQKGTEWFLKPDENVTIRSWSCVYGAD